MRKLLEEDPRLSSRCITSTLLCSSHQRRASMTFDNSKPTFVNSSRRSQAASTRKEPILCLINGELLLIIMAIILQVDCVYSEDCNELNYFMKMRKNFLSNPKAPLYTLTEQTALILR